MGKRTQSKAKTFTIEGCNSFFRHFLASIRRKSECYSKCEKMLEYSFKLPMDKWNGELAMLNLTIPCPLCCNHLKDSQSLLMREHFP